MEGARNRCSNRFSRGIGGSFQSPQGHSSGNTVQLSGIMAARSLRQKGTPGILMLARASLSRRITPLIENTVTSPVIFSRRLERLERVSPPPSYRFIIQRIIDRIKMARRGTNDFLPFVVDSTNRGNLNASPRMMERDSGFLGLLSRGKCLRGRLKNDYATTKNSRSTNENLCSRSQRLQAF